MSLVLDNRINVGIGDAKIGNSPSLIVTSLGSCVAICLYSQQKQVGGMLHFMLPEAGNNQDRETRKFKYADVGLQALIDDIKKKYQVESSGLIAKVFGGAKVLKMVTKDIGFENQLKAKELLKETGIRIVAQDLGGEKGCSVHFDLTTGKVLYRQFGSIEKEY